MILEYEGRDCITYQREVYKMSGKTRTRTQNDVVLFGKLCSFQHNLMLILGHARDQEILWGHIEVSSCPWLCQQPYLWAKDLCIHVKLMSPRTKVMTWLKRLMFTVVQEKPRPALGVHSSAAAGSLTCKGDVECRRWMPFLSPLNVCNPPKERNVLERSMDAQLTASVTLVEKGVQLWWALSPQYQCTSERTQLLFCLLVFITFLNPNELQRRWNYSVSGSPNVTALKWIFCCRTCLVGC